MTFVEAGVQISWLDVPVTPTCDASTDWPAIKRGTTAAIANASTRFISSKTLNVLPEENIRCVHARTLGHRRDFGSHHR
jgi:hypothetical protein